MLTGNKAELEIIEEYTVEGKKRFRIRIKGLNIIFNLSASSPHEAASKAAELAVKLGLIKK
jgi:hypothetical protein